MSGRAVAQWLSAWLETEGPQVQASPASPHCSPWARHIYPSLVLVQPRKTRPYIYERLLMECKESNQTKIHLWVKILFLLQSFRTQNICYYRQILKQIMNGSYSLDPLCPKSILNKQEYQILSSIFLDFTFKILCIFQSGPMGFIHRRSSQYTVTHVGNRNSNIQGRSPSVANMIFHAIRNCSKRK